LFLLACFFSFFLTIDNLSYFFIVFIQNQPDADAKADLRNDTQTDLRDLRTDLRAVSDLRLVSTNDNKKSPRLTKKNTFHIPKEEDDM